MQSPREEGGTSEEVIVYKSPEWPEVGKDENYATYLGRELSKRRVVWRVTLKDKAIAEEEAAEQEEEEEGGGGIMMMISGGSCTEIVFTAVEISTNMDTVNMGLCFPTGITNADIFWTTNLMPEGFPWQFAATNLPVTTNSVVWSWTNLVETNVFLAAGDADKDTDGDGLKDAREFFLYGTQMSQWDTDGDSYSDGEEVYWGTNPKDVTSMPRLGRGVVINEILYNPSGTDTGKEWVELFNTNRVNVDLSEFRIQVASNAFTNVFLFPTNTILNSGDFLLVGGSSVTNADHVVELNMINRFSAGPTAGIRLVAPDVMSSQVVDTCLYATNNSFGLPTTGFGTDGFAPWAAESFSVVRIAIGHDTDHAGDWSFTNGPTATGQGELLDIDGDGINNSVEIAGYTTTYGVVHTDFNNADTDFDGLSDGVEQTNSPATDGTLYDTDGDAFPYSTNGIFRGNDGDEVNTMGTDPTDPDSDNDGLPDGWEAAMNYNPTNFLNGNADATNDFDGDGVSNVDEMNQNSNPTDAGDSIGHEYRFVLYHQPRAGWQNGDDMGTLTWVGYRFENILTQTKVAFVISDGGNTAETFEVEWMDATDTDETGGRANVVWATLLPSTTPKLIVRDGGTTWPNENPAERGADLSVQAITPRFLKNDNSSMNLVKEALNVSNYVTTNELPKSAATSFGTTSSDADNFRLEVEDSYASGSSVDMDIQVNSGADTTYTLAHKSGSKFRGVFLRLVTDTSDGAASENGTSSDPDDQTILVKLGDTVRLKYSPVPGAIIDREFSVARPVAENNNGANQLNHDIREVQLHVLVFQNLTNSPSVSRTQVETDVSDANERLAQSGIRLVATIDMGGGGDPGLVLPTGAGINWTNGFDGITINGSGGLHAEETALFGSKDSDANTIDVFYVDVFSSAMIALVGDRARAYPSFLAGGNSLYPNNIAVASTASGGGFPNTFAHEVLHILLDDAHRANEPDTALFKGGTTTSKAVNGTKRIGPYPDAAAAGVGNGDTSTIRGHAEALP